jgi:serine/threonine protein kinase
MSTPETERLLAGRYRLRAVIGRGGMGAVWRARDELLNRDVAVKEIIWPPEMDEAERETGRRRAVREAQMVARLRHPNVVGVYDFFEEDGRPAIVMELVPFQSLHDAVRDVGRLPSARVARIGLGVLAGLRAAHQAGIVHRDVKPANILLGPEDRIVLTDFGIAKAVDSPALTTSGILIGSPSYISPEQAHGERADAAADLWGLGASLYTAVEGKPPFERPGVLASLTAVVSEEPEPPMHAGPLEPVINGLLRKDPGTRLGAADAERMLQDVLEQDAAAVRTAPRTGPVLVSGPAADTGPCRPLNPRPPSRRPPSLRRIRNRCHRLPQRTLRSRSFRWSRPLLE